MNINSTVITALTTLALPVAANIYEGTASEYIVFDYLDERPNVYADDTDTHDITRIRVNYYTKGDTQTNKKAIRRLLRAAGFTIESSPPEYYETDTGYNHAIVEAWIEGEIDDG